MQPKNRIVSSLVTFFVIITALNLAYALSLNHYKTHSLDQLNDFYNFWGKGKPSVSMVHKNKLPSPYDFLLTQPLMTIGIESYYQRTPKIQTIHAAKNQKNTYSRAILMLIDSKKTRNDASIAQSKKEALVVELAFITMNFSELPNQVISGVLHGDVPFGKLVVANQLKTYDKGRQYFAVNCDLTMAKLVRCKLNSKLYGRTNTIVRADNKKWIARVVEILPGLKCKDKQCQNITV